jgi:precorrin-4/cobalt-precorrin-4 C11-methyltransferase
MRRLDALGIAYDLTPGVPAFAAAAAALGIELTLPDVAQTVILTRTAVRASAMPKGEELATLAQSRATLVLHLSINNLARIVRELAPIYGEHCPVAVVHRASWPDEKILRGTLMTIRAQVKAAGFTRTALVIIGRVLGQRTGSRDFSDSRLYAPSHHHVLRPRKKRSATARKV